MEWNVASDLRTVAPWSQLPRVGLPRRVRQPNFVASGFATLDLCLDNKDGPLQAKLDELKQEGHWAFGLRETRSYFHVGRLDTPASSAMDFESEIVKLDADGGQKVFVKENGTYVNNKATIVRQGDVVYVLNSIFGPKGADAKGRKLKGSQFRRATVSADMICLGDAKSADYICGPISFVHVYPVTGSSAEESSTLDELDVDEFANMLGSSQMDPVLPIPPGFPDGGIAAPAVAATPSRVVMAQRVDTAFVHAGTPANFTLEQYEQLKDDHKKLQEQHEELQEQLRKMEAELLEAQQEMRQLKRHRPETGPERRSPRARGGSS